MLKPLSALDMFSLILVEAASWSGGGHGSCTGWLVQICWREAGSSWRFAVSNLWGLYCDLSTFDSVQALTLIEGRADRGFKDGEEFLGWKIWSRRSFNQGSWFSWSWVVQFNFKEGAMRWVRISRFGIVAFLSLWNRIDGVDDVLEDKSWDGTSFGLISSKILILPSTSLVVWATRCALTLPSRFDTCALVWLSTRRHADCRIEICGSRQMGCLEVLAVKVTFIPDRIWVLARWLQFGSSNWTMISLLTFTLSVRIGLIQSSWTSLLGCQEAPLAEDLYIVGKMMVVRGWGSSFFLNLAD